MAGEGYDEYMWLVIVMSETDVRKKGTARRTKGGVTTRTWSLFVCLLVGWLVA